MPKKEVIVGRNEAKQRAAEEKAERIRTKDFFFCLFSPWAQTSSGHSSSGYSPQARRRTFIRSAFRARRIRTGCISDGINSAQISSPTLTAERRTRRQAISSFSATAGRGRVIFSNSSSQISASLASIFCGELCNGRGILGNRKEHC